MLLTQLDVMGRYSVLSKGRASEAAPGRPRMNSSGGSAQGESAAADGGELHSSLE